MYEQMSSVRLDRDRPFGQVCGGTEGWRFEQDGKRFDAEGFEVVEPATVVSVKMPPGVESAGGVDGEEHPKVKRRSR